jgi:hypothetical protein
MTPEARAAIELLRDRVDGLVMWAESRLRHLEQRLSDENRSTRPDYFQRIELKMEQTTLRAVLAQLRGEA